MDKESEKQYMMTAIMKEFNYQPPLSLPEICEGLVRQGYGNLEQILEKFAKDLIETFNNYENDVYDAEELIRNRLKIFIDEEVN